MKVELLNYTPLWVCSDAVRTCWASQDKSDTGLKTKMHDSIGTKDAALIDRVGNKFKHSSTLEHLFYNFHISDISRAVLQELSRHRIASLSVKSTRYTLKELKQEQPFVLYEHGISYDPEWTEVNYYPKRAKKYIVFTGNENVDIMSVMALENLRKILKQGISNDVAKYCLPECYKTELAWSINARSLQNFLSLRTNKAALQEIQDLANEIYNQIPEDHKYLFSDCVSVKEPKEPNGMD